MSRFLLVVSAVGVAFGSPALTRAQAASPVATAAIEWIGVEQAQPTPPARPATPTPPAQPGAPKQLPPPPPAAPPAALALPAPPAPPPAPRRLVNIQLEFTITDHVGGAAPDKKTVSMMASDGTWGRIRATAVAKPRGGGPLPVSLNVDARPLTTANDTIQTEITIEYRPIGASIGDEPTRVDPTVLNQSLTVVLQNGKSMTISQAADPVSDRKIVVEVRATVLK